MRKKSLSLILTVLALPIFAFGQTEHFKTTHKVNKDRSVDLIVDYRGFGTRTIFISFSKLTNCYHPLSFYVPVSHQGVYERLRPTESDKPISFSYKGTCRLGEVNPKKVDTTFIYRLPYSVEKTVQARDLSNKFFESLHGKSKQKNFRSLQFLMDKGDTVYAARKGIVVSLTDKHEPSGQGLKISVSSKSNSLLIEHNDGTFARYSVLEYNSFMVKEGDVVYPNTPLALAGTYDNIEYQVRFNIFYSTLDKFEKQEDLDNMVTVFVNPFFATDDGNIQLKSKHAYRAVINDGLLKKEMTKREIKRSDKK